MCVDVVNIFLIDARFRQRAVECQGEAFAFLVLSSDVIGIAGRTIADEFTINTSATCLCVLERFENENTRTFAHHKAVA